MSLAEDNDLKWYQLHIGKSHPKPYIKNESGDVFIFENDCITQSVNLCGNCEEPLVKQEELCPWCSITEAHEDEAAQNNPFRMIDRMGRLESYMDSMGKLDN